MKHHSVQLILGLVKFCAGLLILLVSLPVTANLAALPAWFSNEPTHLHSQHSDIKTIYVLEDKRASLQLADVINIPRNQWRPVEQDVPSYGFKPYPFWFAIPLTNQAQKANEFFLHLDYPALDHIDVYLHDGRKLIQFFSTGDQLPFDDRPLKYPGFLFPLEIEPESAALLFVRVQTEGSVLVPISLWRKETFLDFKQKEILVYGIVTGIFLIMSFYNLFLFISVRDKSYLYFGLFTLSYLGLTLSLEGYAYQWLWPELPHVQQRSVLMFSGLSSLFLILFTKHFLPISSESKMRTWIRALTVIGCLNLIAVSSLPYFWAAGIQSVIGTLAVLSAALVSLVLSARSQSLARFFLAAWLLFFIGVLSNILNTLGLIPYSKFSEYSAILGAIIGLVMLSFALGYRIRLEMNKKHAAKQEAMEHLARYRSLYENSVEGIFLLDDEFKLLEANPRFYELTFRSDQSHSPLNFLHLFTNHLRQQDFAEQLNNGEHIRNFEMMLHVPQNVLDHPVWLGVSVKPVSHPQTSNAHYEGSLIDISDLKQFEVKLKDLALHDSLTGLLRRRSFESACREQLRGAAEHSVSGLLYIDIDQFRVINELCGFTAGDTLLKQVAKIIGSTIGRIGSPYRLSRFAADEFATLLIDTNEDALKDCAERIRQSIETLRFEWETQDYQIECSVGLLIIEGKHFGIAELFNRAKKCCDTAKGEGRNRIHVEHEKEQAEQDERTHMAWINTIREATKNNYFQLQIQAIENTENVFAIKGQAQQSLPQHFEVLLRLNLPDDAGVAPDQFIPSAERYELMPLIDRWVIGTFFDWVKRNPQQVKTMQLASINLSMQSIGDPQFKLWLNEMFEQSDLSPEKVCLEVTETVAMTNSDVTRDFIEHFSKLGCQFALDDFGTGFSSYAYLKSLGVNYVKIDGVFIHNIVNNPVDYTMVKSICEIAQAMEIQTIAEYVENRETLECLEALGVDMVQGYFVHKPEPLNDTNWS